MTNKTRIKRVVLKPWAKVMLGIAGMVLLALAAYAITNAFVGGDDGTPYSAPTATEQPRTEDGAASSYPPPPTEPPHPYTDKVCSVLDGKYLNSVDEAKALDKRLYGYYQSVKQENGVVVGFIQDLHDDPTDLKWLNGLLTDDVAKECENR